jgi:dihydrofolate synthase/folylpolyglutamate synthase
LVIALDHCRILGNTVEEIAERKAGIFKKGIPALVGPGVPFQIMKVDTA